MATSVIPGTPAKVVVRAGTTDSLQTRMEQAIDAATSAAVRAETAADNIEALNTPYVENACAYGIEFDTATQTPDCTRIGNMSLHASLPIQNRMKGCLLKDDGTVYKYLNPSDWKQEVRDGSFGQVMVELPEHYRKFVSDGTKRQVLLSEYPLAGYHKVQKCI